MAATFAAAALLLLHLLLLHCCSAFAATAAAAFAAAAACRSVSAQMLPLLLLPCLLRSPAAAAPPPFSVSFFQINCVDKRKVLINARAANKGSKEGSNKKLLPFLSSSRLPAVQNELFGLLRRLGAAQCIY